MSLSDNPGHSNTVALGCLVADDVVLLSPSSLGVLVSRSLMMPPKNCFFSTAKQSVTQFYSD